MEQSDPSLNPYWLIVIFLLINLHKISLDNFSKTVRHSGNIEFEHKSF